MANTALFTIIAKNYLPYARTLMDSARRHAPEIERVVVLVDEPEGYFDPSKEDFLVVFSRDLKIPQSEWFHFKYSILELSTAVKPYAAEYLLSELGVDKLIYFDPDIRIYSSIEDVVRSLQERNLVLTPHLTSPLEDDRKPGELEILQAGAYNLGFIGLSASRETFRFLKWWQTRLYDRCVVDVPRGLFVDQRWVDLVPGLFDGVYICRDPGWNVAYWNIQDRTVKRNGEGYLAQGVPLVFFHFSGVDPAAPEVFSRHQNRHRTSALGDGRDLVLEYIDELFARGYEECSKWPYFYGHFRNGIGIPDVGRPVHHIEPHITGRVEDPFSDLGFDEFVRVWNATDPHPSGQRGIARLALRIYQTRQDVQDAMPDVFRSNRVAFLNWLVSQGAGEHHIDPAFLTPTLRELVGSRNGVSAASEGETRVRTWPSQKGDFHIPALARAIWESRSDLQRAFPDPGNQDAARFLTWTLTYGRREHNIGESTLARLRAQWASVGQKASGAARWRERLSLTAKSASAAVRRAGEDKRPRSMEVLPPQSCSVRSRLSWAVLDREPGLNVIGYTRAETGVGEIVRSSIASAHAANLPTSLKVIDSLTNRDDSPEPGSSDFPHAFNLFHVNADQLPHVAATLGDRWPKQGYNIGYWAWELESFPDRWRSSFEYLDEIWTLSSFCQDAIARKSSVPVIRMWPAVKVCLEHQYSREDFGLPEASFLFLTMFDLLSVTERKNPLAVVEAFLQAFPRSVDCHLVMKVNHGATDREFVRMLRERVAGTPITVIDGTLDRDAVNGLISVCDCVVSLHRAEGFGLTLAEAMYLGKATIATCYSGNLDFTRPDNAFLVRYRTKLVGPGCAPYDPEATWADPSISDAVEKMRLVVSNAELRSCVAQKGTEYVRQFLSREAAGRRMRERLEELRANMQMNARRSA